MANAIYPKFKEALLNGSANTDMSSGNVKIALVDTGVYTYSATHTFLSDLSGVIGSTGNLGTKTFTNGQFDSDGGTVTEATGNTAEAFVIYIDTGTPGTSRLVGYFDTGHTGLPVTPNGGDITIEPSDSNGWFTL